MTTHDTHQQWRHIFGAETTAATPISVGDGGSTILSQEGVVQDQLELAQLRSGLRVLEVGSGSGYLAAHIADAVGDPALVHGIDVHESVVEYACEKLGSIGLFGARLKAGNGLNGWPEPIQFDRIIFSCALYEFPWKCLAQLAPGGILVVPMMRNWPFEGAVLAVRSNGGGWIEAIDARVATFMPASGQEVTTPHPLVSSPVAPILEDMESVSLVSPANLPVNLPPEARWNRSYVNSDKVFPEIVMMRMAATIAVFWPEQICFLALKGYSPLYIGLISTDRTEIAAVSCSPTPYQFGPILSIGPTMIDQLDCAIRMASAPFDAQVEREMLRWSPNRPWAIIAA